MQIKIELKQKTDTKQSLAYLINNQDDVAKLPLNANEIDYVKWKIKEDKDQLIVINSYSRWNYIKMCDSTIDFNKSIETIRKTGNDIIGHITKHKVETLQLVSFNENNKYLIALAEGIVLGNYSFNRHFTKDKAKKKVSLNNLFLVSDILEINDIRDLEAVVEGVYHARDIVNEPLSHSTPKQFSELLKVLGKDAGLTVEVFDKKKIESLKMGGLLAVNRGSLDPPTFNVLEWKPENCVNTSPYILVGKGVMFDTGGINLKPGSYMDTMKSDKGGAAAVAGAMYSIAKSKLPVHIIALIPATDNRPGVNAYVPQDIITMFDGSTVEVLNTDAEGRMILADALAYAKKYKPEFVIDLATLTGAAVVAVGTIAIAGMTNNSEKLEALKQSGMETYERIVELPLWEEYNEQLKSDFADIKNIGGRYGGAITAGKFLEHFTDYPWVHLDIAGPAYLDSADSYRGKNATGSGVRLLYSFFKQIANNKE